MAYRSSSAPVEPPREAVARILWIEPNGTRYEVIRHVSALQSLRDKVDWIAVNYHPCDWPTVRIYYWHTMADLLDGYGSAASETLMFPLRPSLHQYEAPCIS